MQSCHNKSTYLQKHWYCLKNILALVHVKFKILFRFGKVFTIHRWFSIMSQFVRGSSDEIREKSRFIVFIWIICRLMGLIPLSIRISRENGRTVWIASYSRGWTIYSWTVLAFTGKNIESNWWNHRMFKCIINLITYARSEVQTT